MWSRLHFDILSLPKKSGTLDADLVVVDSEVARGLLRWPGIEPTIARRRTPHGNVLDKVRWVVERTIGWLKGLRQLCIRYDRLRIIQRTWITLAA
ncbi:MAG: transposase [Gemmataceae bacterium]